jgi:hypothetical protein
MERANHLTRLRERGKVPDDFTCSAADATQRENVKKIIEWLLQKQPSLRPNASDLLKSGLIPLKLEDEYMDQVCGCLLVLHARHFLTMPCV